MAIANPIQVDNNTAVVVDEWYNEEEYANTFEECKFLINYGADPSKTGSATDSNNNLLKNNKATFVRDLFLNMNDSVIFRDRDKLYTILDFLISVDPIYNYLRNTDTESLLVSYYEDSSYYKPHNDKSIFTTLTWLYDEPKAFGGGNLILRNRDNNIVKEIECKSNRAVIFPSFISHEVTNVVMNKEDMGKKKGRFTVSQFSGLNTAGP